MVVAGGDERLYPSTGHQPSAMVLASTVVDGTSGNVPETHDPTLKPVEGYSPSSLAWRQIPQRERYKGSYKCPLCEQSIAAYLSYCYEDSSGRWMCLECGVQRGLVW